ncbi:winged helix-turn-helix transcriptional regulator [Streptomyces sp. NBC_01604]|uniref:winged helix-turn-helix transcriptional regulator n=1 Tax=Streptomyces sp. NBC_01604 TaxID=2975894 RepID=UPI00386E6BEC
MRATPYGVHSRCRHARTPLSGLWTNPPAPSAATIETLRAMERDGLLTRTAYDENPSRVEYALTPLGRTLIPLPRLLAARHAHRRNAA